MPMVTDANGTPLNAPTGGGLLSGLDPDYQVEVAKAALARQQVDQAQAFKGGLPTDAQGNPDYTAAANRLFQLGDYGNAGNLMKAGFQMDAMRSLGGPDPFASGAPAGQRAATGAPGGGTAGNPASPGTTAPNSRGGNPTKGANPEVVSFIASTAQSLGISPAAAMKVAASEGLRGFDPSGNANLGDDGSSAGPFQLHYGGVASGGNRVAGLGDDFSAATGLDARNPSTWKQQVVFALQHAAKNGWGAFHGAAAVNMGPWDGIGAAPASSAAAPSPGGQPVQSTAIGPNDPVPDDLYQVALRVVGQAQNADPRKMSLDEQRAVNRAQDLVDQYQRQGNSMAQRPAPVAALAPQPVENGSAVRVAQNGASDATAGATPHPFGPDAPGLQPSAAPTPAQPTQPPPANGSAGGAPAGLPAQPAAPMQTALQANLAADPTMGGLLSGQFVGNPAGAITYLRGRASQLAVAGMDGAAKNFEARAQNIERAIQPTPEQKNARDPNAVAYEQNRTRFQQQVKDQGEIATAGPVAAAKAQADLDVRSTPQAIRQAGQLAAAQAGGTAQGQAPYELVPTQPTPGGPTVLAPKSDVLAGAASAVKAQPAQFAEQQKAITANEAAMAGQFQKRQVAAERIDAMSNLLSTVETGYGTPAFSDALAKVRAAGFNIPDSVAANPAAVQQFGKNATANIFSQAGDLGGKVLVSELDGLKQSNANAGLQPAANQAILAQQRGIIDREDAYFKAYTDWKKANLNAVGNDVAQFDTTWSKANPVAGFVAAAKKNIAPLGVQVPAPAQREVGQRYAVPGKGVFRWMGNGWSPN